MAAGGDESEKMEYSFLGKSGLRVSRVCLGTMTFGEWGLLGSGQLDEAGAHALLDKFVSLGGNFIDTADVYAGGRSEEILGRWLAKQGPEVRRRLVLSTKVRFPTDRSDENAVGLSRSHVLDGVEASLSRLGVSHIDILFTHAWDEGTPLSETLGALRDLVAADKVRYVGVSNVKGWQLQRLVSEGRAMGVPIVALQTQYSLLCRGPVEWELQEVCEREGVALLPWSPLKGGWLTGKIKRGEEAPEGSRVRHAEETGTKLQSMPGLELGTDRVFDLLDAMRAVSDKTELSMPQLAIRWLLQQTAVSAVVIGAKSEEQLLENAAAAFPKAAPAPDQEWVSQLTAASEVPKPYPYEMVDRVQAGRK